MTITVCSPVLSYYCVGLAMFYKLFSSKTCKQNPSGKKYRLIDLSFYYVTAGV
jgi:hypothetical protein